MIKTINYCRKLISTEVYNIETIYQPDYNQYLMNLNFEKNFVRS